MVKHIFIINPTSGNGQKLDDVRTMIHSAMSPRGLKYEFLSSVGPGHAKMLAKAHAAPGVRIYACGGDGTVQEILTGIRGVEDVQLAHYPLGTGNDFIRQFGSQGERFKDLSELIDGEVSLVDIIHSEERDALNVFSMGFDARVPMEMQKFRKLQRFGSQMPYNAAVVSSIFKGLGTYYHLLVDGVRYSGKLSLVVAMNGQYYGGGFHPTPEARADDGYLNVIIVRKVSVIGLGRVIGKYAKGLAKEISVCTCIHAKKLSIRANKAQAVNFDGEGELVTELDVELIPKALQLVLPRGIKLSDPNENARNSEQQEAITS